MRLRSTVIPGTPEPYPSVVIEDEDADGVPLPAITVYYDITGTGIVVKRIEADEIDSRVLRGIRIADWRAAIRRMLVDDPSRVGGLAFLARHASAESEEEERLMSLAIEATEDATELLRHTTPKRGRGAQNDDLYRAVAIAYLDLYPVHGQRTSQALAERLGADSTTVYRWTQRARERNWLSSGQQGRAGAEPGPRLKRWLREKEQEK